MALEKQTAVLDLLWWTALVAFLAHVLCQAAFSTVIVFCSTSVLCLLICILSNRQTKIVATTVMFCCYLLLQLVPFDVAAFELPVKEVRAWLSLIAATITAAIYSAFHREFVGFFALFVCTLIFFYLNNSSVQ